jgi:hypothetical protein
VRCGALLPLFRLVGVRCIAALVESEEPTASPRRSHETRIGRSDWTYDFTDRFFVEGFVGGALHNGELEGDATHAALGCRRLFHVGGSAGYRLTPRWSAMVTLDHVSDGNAAFGACPRNAGLNEYGFRLGYAF